MQPVLTTTSASKMLAHDLCLPSRIYSLQASRQPSVSSRPRALNSLPESLSCTPGGDTHCYLAGPMGSGKTAAWHPVSWRCQVRLGACFNKVHQSICSLSKCQEGTVYLHTPLLWQNMMGTIPLGRQRYSSMQQGPCDSQVPAYCGSRQGAAEFSSSQVHQSSYIWAQQVDERARGRVGVCRSGESERRSNESSASCRVKR